MKILSKKKLKRKGGIFGEYWQNQDILPILSTNDVVELEFYDLSRGILIFKLKPSWQLCTQVTVDIGVLFEDLFLIKNDK